MEESERARYLNSRCERAVASALSSADAACTNNDRASLGPSRMNDGFRGYGEAGGRYRKTDGTRIGALTKSRRDGLRRNRTNARVHYAANAGDN